MNAWKNENLFYLTSNKLRLLKIIDHYEIYKRIINIKGDIIECGVFKGISLIRFLSFRDLLEKSKKRKIFAFDIFGKFPRPKNKKIRSQKNDVNFAKSHDLKIGRGFKLEKLNSFLKKKKFSNYKLIKGDVNYTIPIFVKKNKKMKISLLHLDLDVYEPTFIALEYFYEKVTPGGIILIDDYKHIRGATLAVNDFFKNKKIKISKVSKKGRPFYIIKKLR
tara:strand:+ start:303 stop:962 length:660 start_codon:yes stop_codon:yes gene_type:complete